MTTKDAVDVLRKVLDELPSDPTDEQLDAAAGSCSRVAEILRRSMGPKFTFHELPPRQRTSSP